MTLTRSPEKINGHGLEEGPLWHQHRITLVPPRSRMSTGTTATEPSAPARSETSLWAKYRRHWRLIVVVSGAVLALALLAALIRPPIYTAEARLAVGSGQMTALNIPGYPTASQEMASNYARWITSEGVAGGWAPEGTLDLSASPIVDSNVLRIEATSTDPDTALTAASTATNQLKEAVNEVAEVNDPDALMQEIQDNIGPLTQAERQVSTARTRYNEALDEGASQSAIEEAFDAYVAAEQAYTALNLQQNGREDRYRGLVSSRSTEADLVDVAPASVVGSDRGAVVQRNGLLGLLLGLGLAALLVSMKERRGGRHLERQPEGAAESAAADDATTGEAGIGDERVEVDTGSR